MKIAVIDTTLDRTLLGEIHAFLPKLLNGLSVSGNEVHLITKGTPNEKVFQQIEESNAILHPNLWPADGFIEETAPVLARWLNELNPDIYLIFASDDIGWVVLPFLSPQIATLAIGHTDSEAFYLPVRHYRSFLTRIIGVSPEVCVGCVLSSVIDKERVEWISDGEQAQGAESPGGDENILKIIENYENCFEKAIEDAKITSRETYTDYPLMEPSRSRLPMWLRRLKAKVMN